MLQSRKRPAFREGNLSALQILKSEVKSELKRAKLRYKEKTQREMGNNNLGSAWDSMKTIVGLKRDNILRLF